MQFEGFVKKMSSAEVDKLKKKRKNADLKGKKCTKTLFLAS